jgi:cytochrome oxidase Cu insertion factor (SCO1/SenC/PrrC family)
MKPFARRIIVLAAALHACAGLALSGSARAGEPAASAAIDHKAPEFTLPGVDGKTYKLSDFKGKYVVLEWINFDCPFVKKHYSSGNMQAMQKQYAGKDVVWFSVCSSAEGKQGYYEPAALEGMLKERKFASSAYLRDADGTVGRLYGAKTTPHMFVINPEGVLIYAGAIDDKPSTNLDDIKGSKNYVAACLDAAMSGKAVETKSTTSYGCSVKYAN